MANAITTPVTTSTTLELQAERTWDYLAGGDYTAIFQWMENIPWVRIYTIVIQAAMAFITFFYVAGYIAGRAARLAYDTIRAALPVVLDWLSQQRERAMALRQQFAGTPSTDSFPTHTPGGRPLPAGFIFDGMAYQQPRQSNTWVQNDPETGEPAFTHEFPSLSLVGRSFGPELDQEPCSDCDGCCDLPADEGDF